MILDLFLDLFDLLFVNLTEGITLQNGHESASLNARGYYRFQVSLDILCSDDMDDTSEQNLHELKAVAEELIRKEGHRLYQLCERL